MNKFELHHGDCLEVMAGMEAGSVDAVVCDPPYGTMNGAELDGWSENATIWDTALDCSQMFSECNRLLRTSGALVLFSQEPYTSHIIKNAHGNVPFAYRMVWLKDHFANSLIAKTAPVNYTEDVCVFFKKYDTLSQHPLREYSKKIMDFIGLDLKKINDSLGHRKAEHFFYTESTQFGLCTEQTYTQIIEKWSIHNQPWFLTYEELLDVNRRFNRRFNLPKNKKYKSNVLQYRKDYTGLHPTQKPVALMVDIIETYTNEGETVLDFTMGSGTTGVAAMLTGRRFIGIEKDAEYFAIAQERISTTGKPKPKTTTIQGRKAVQVAYAI